MDTIAILSDFGNRDAFVGTMKAVMLSIAPQAKFIDLCHEIQPQDILSGGLMLGTCAKYLPKGSVLLGIVDPGVGTERREILVECEDLWVIGPDNGLFSLVYDARPPKRAFEITNRDYAIHPISNTFHGRDIFSPAAAHLINGAAPESFGPEIAVDELAKFAEIGPLIKDESVECRVVHIDHFGNVATNLSRDVLDAAGRKPKQVQVRGVVAPFRETFSDVNFGEAVCYYSSNGYLEIGVRNGHAGDVLEIKHRDSLHVLTDPT